jgi:pyrroline-5-carboxylate reductase
VDTTKIGFIGAGNMANSLIRGLLAKGVRGDAIWATDVDAVKLKQLAGELGIHTASAEELVAHVDVLVLAVKPQVMRTVCKQIGSKVQAHQPLCISIAAGITLGHLQNWLGADTALVRCMPNTPALVSKGASGLFANDSVSEWQRKIALDLMSSVGLAVWLEQEADIDTVTALSGSGPAYFFLFMEAMQAAAIAMGLNADLARALTYQTAAGAAELAQQSTDDTAQLRRNVTSPGGTTERAIAQVENGALRELVMRSLQAARQRSTELAAEFGND